MAVIVNVRICVTNTLMYMLIYDSVPMYRHHVQFSIPLQSQPHPSEQEPTRSSRTKYSIIIQPEMLCDDYVCQISKLGTSNLPGS